MSGAVAAGEAPVHLAATLPPLRWRWLGEVGYRTAWELQRALAARRAQGDSRDDAVVLLTHPPVYTLGRGTDPDHVPGGPARLRSLGAECHDVDRGGSVTFHGPGQLVAYPVIGLADVFPDGRDPRHGDVHAYLRALEAALVATCAAAGVRAAPRAPYTGAWVGSDKVGAIGVKLSRGVTQHGVALNVTTDLRWFDAVVPCGIRDGGVTSLQRLGARDATVEALAPRLADALAQAFSRPLAPASELRVSDVDVPGASGATAPAA